ncbi:TPA: dATP/dGTP pyrophosphohydrolase domain-containing protein, partial [Salmonella enterica subsp. enterica]
PASERERIRREHAEWSDATFGDVGPIGPLKHLSKEALETAAEPGDLSEWADMQFLLWDAQRRAGITDEQIALAMVEKLAVNKKREWPEPKDGEPRLHIKEQSAPVIPDGWISCSERMPDSKTGVLVAREFGRKGDWRMKWATYIPWHPDTNDGWLIPGASWKPSHWMPLPEPPQQ